MNINKFAVAVTREEKGRKEVNIAQVKEVLKVINRFLGGKLYIMIRSL